MIFAILASLGFSIAGVVVSALALKKDEIKQGLYGHTVFYLFLFAIASIAFGSLTSLSETYWYVLVYVSLAWIIAGRVLTLLRLFKALTYFHLVAGLLTVIWIIVNSFIFVSFG